MFHGTLALLNRSIRGDALTRHAHLLRLAAVGIILLMLLGAHEFAAKAQSGAPGLPFLYSLSNLGIALISLAAVGHFSTAITEEREAGTLGLLLLADLSPLSILLGKSTNRIFSAWLLLAAMFPFTLLSLTLGGLTVSQVAAVILALAGYLFLVANLSLLISVFSRKSGEAATVTALLLVVWLGAPFLVETLRTQLLSQRVIVTGSLGNDRLKTLIAELRNCSILVDVAEVCQSQANPGFPSEQVLVSLAGGLLCFGIAWLRFRRMVLVQDFASLPAEQRFSLRWTRTSRTSQRPWQAALAWKDFQFIAGGWGLLTAKSLLLAAGIAVCLMFHQFVRNAVALNALTFLRQALAGILAIELLACSTQLYQVERSGGTLTTLLLLPKSILRISCGKAAGCLLASIPTILAFVAVWMLPNDLLESSGGGMPAEEGDASALIIIACVILLLSQATVLCSLIVRFGSLPLALALVLVLGSILGPFLLGAATTIGWLGAGGPRTVLPVLYITLIGSFGLQWEIGRRVTWIAGRD